MSINITAPDLADKLRADLNEGLIGRVIATDAAYMLADAVEIADSCARADIECNVHGYDDGWHDTTNHDPEDTDAIVQALRYLGARGLIEHHPEHGHLVRFPKVTQ